MSSNDLFSFLDQAPEDLDTDEPMQETEYEVPKKRKVDLERTPDPPKNGSHAPEEYEAGPSASKKQRVASPPDPIVVDEVEIEAKREVAASAGLTGSVEAGSRLELRHQVRSIHINIY